MEASPFHGLLEGPGRFERPADSWAEAMIVRQSSGTFSEPGVSCVDRVCGGGGVVGLRGRVGIGVSQAACGKSGPTRGTSKGIFISLTKR